MAEEAAKWWVYLLESTAGRRTYIGITCDLDKRLRQHNGELTGGARSTRSGRPWSVVRRLGPYGSRSVASRVEYFWKKAKGTRRRSWQPSSELLEPTPT